MFQKYGVDSAGLQEVCVNWAKVPQSKSLANSLRAAAENIRSVASHNKSEGEAKGMGYTQMGGDRAGAQREVGTYVTDSGVDLSGLGRWSWCQLEGSEGIKTRIVSAYAPTGSLASREEIY